MQKLQKFGGAMFTPVLLFSFAGIMVALTVIFTNPMLVGDIAQESTNWYKFWMIIQNGAWSVFTQMNLLFVIGLPIGLAKTANARAAMESFITYVTLQLFISGILDFWGPSFGVDFTQEAASGTGLAMVASVKTLDTGILGAILVAAIVTWLHNRYFDKKLPDFLGVFQGSSYVVILGFFLMVPLAFLLCLVWPRVQMGIDGLQGFMKSSGYFGGWLFIFLERLLIPTGLHHFIYTPFRFGPAVVDGGTTQYWIDNMSTFAQSNTPLKELFPEGIFAMYGNSKIFGSLGIAGALYATARKANKKRVLALLIPATLTAMLAGITEPLEFTFLFVAPVLFAIHAFLAATMTTVMYAFGVVGEMPNGIIEQAAMNWIPMFSNHSGMIVTQFVIGLLFSGIYFLVFRFVILKWNLPTPGREAKDKEIKLYTKEDYKNKKDIGQAASQSANRYFPAAQGYMEALGGAENIASVTNCATRLRVSVLDETKVGGDEAFQEFGAHGIVRNGTAFQVIVGLDVPQVTEQFKHILNEKNQEASSLKEEA